MRVDLKRWQKKCHMFSAKVGPISREGRQVLHNVVLYRDDGKIIGSCQHINAALKPFKAYKEGDIVKFTGKIFQYQRADYSTDFSVKINKVKPYKEKSLVLMNL